MIDISVFKSLLNKDTFNNYKNVIFQIPLMETEVRSILHSIKDYYKTYPEQDKISVDELKLHFSNLNPVIKNPEIYQNMLDRLYDADINNVELLINSINILAETATANLILQDCIELVNNYKPGGLKRVEKYLKYHEKLTESISGSEADVAVYSLDELLAMDSAENGLKWKIPFLQNTIGSLKGGTLAHIFAYVETGKTSLGIFELVNFTRQLADNECILYLGNEEPVKRTILRAYSALLNSEVGTIRSKKEKADSLWEKHIGHKLKFIDQVKEISKVDQYINDFRPRLVMIDQGAKVNIPGDYSDVKRIQQIFNTYREFAVKYDTIVITLGQGSVDCFNKKYPQLRDLDMSKVGVPGELDACVGIGATDDEGMEEVRYLSVCKNKLTGRLGRGQVQFNYKTCNWKPSGVHHERT